jgi:hypothetical protein
MKIVGAMLCGAVIGAVAVYVWLVWYFRDVMK